MRKYILILSIVIFGGCFRHTPIKSDSATILIKTPSMKFYDTGFITKYPNYTEVQILNAGNVILSLELYEDEVCKDSHCLSNEDFNKEFLSNTYDKQFLKNLFEENKPKIKWIDRENNIKIIITK